jgi:hypothetical protein
MQLSKFNKLFKLFSAHQISDGYGGFDTEFKESYQLFGNISRMSEKRQYQIIIPSKELSLIDNLSLIEYNNQKLVIDKISFDDNIIKINCHDQGNSENSI